MKQAVAFVTSQSFIADVGEIVLTAPQCLARIVSLPQPGIALVLLEMIPVNGAMSSKSKSFEEHYAYIDTQELIWDAGKSYWKPRGTIGNRYDHGYDFAFSFTYYV